jgi:uncharacterized membrane protein YoaK (UPF0700 family)
VGDARRRDLLLAALAFSAGAVDAVALIALSVFTAVMTGNLVLLGIAVGHAAVQSAVRSSIALIAYVVGVLAGARIVGAAASGELWPARATRALAVESALLAAFFVGWIAGGAQPEGAVAGALIGLSGLAMGLQATTTRSIAPGVSTTYVTGALTSLLSELSVLGNAGADAGRRGIIVLALLAGAVTGAVVLLGAPLLAPAVPLIVVGAVVIVAQRSTRAG